MQAATSIDYKQICETLTFENLQLKQQLDQLKKMIFGSRHERFVPTDINPSQLALDIHAERTPPFIAFSIVSSRL